MLFIQENIRKHQSEGTLTEMLECLDESIPSPFDGLETEYLQHKYYKENYNLLVRHKLILISAPPLATCTCVVS